jgi:hypothetical protein
MTRQFHQDPTEFFSVVGAPIRANIMAVNITSRNAALMISVREH